jgi:hypothetical protein
MRIVVALFVPLLMAMAMGEFMLLDLQLVTAIVRDDYLNTTAEVMQAESLGAATVDGAPMSPLDGTGVDEAGQQPVLWTLVTMAAQWQFVDEQQRGQRRDEGADSRSTLKWMLVGPHADTDLHSASTAAGGAALDTAALDATAPGSSVLDPIVQARAHARTSLLIFFRAAFVLLATAAAMAQAAVPLRLWLSRFAQSVRDDRYLIGRQLHDRAAAAAQRAVGGDIGTIVGTAF